MIKFKYGSKKDFDLNNGVKLFDKDIQRMIDECVSRLESNEDWATFQGTGDTMVFAFGFSNDGEHMDEISIYVCKNYELAEAWLNDKGDWEKMDWSKNYEEDEEYQQYTREELIDMIRDYKEKETYYGSIYSYSGR